MVASLNERSRRIFGLDLRSLLDDVEPMLLANTDTHKSFVKILETFRAGSAVFAPLLWQGEALGVIVCASQARNTFDESDLAVHVAFSHLAAAQWMAHDGPAYLESLIRSSQELS